MDNHEKSDSEIDFSSDEEETTTEEEETTSSESYSDDSKDDDYYLQMMKNKPVYPEYVEFYKGDGHALINGFLTFPNREQYFEMKDELIQYIKSLDKLMTKYGDGKTVLYKGVPFDLKERESNIIVNTKFLSCSPDKEVSRDFMRGKKCCIFVFVIPPNVKYYDGLLEDVESEIIVERDTYFTITDVSNPPLVYVTLDKFTPKPVVLKQTDEQRRLLLAKLKKEIFTTKFS